MRTLTGPYQTVPAGVKALSGAIWEMPEPDAALLVVRLNAAYEAGRAAAQAREREAYVRGLERAARIADVQADSDYAAAVSLRGAKQGETDLATVIRQWGHTGRRIAQAIRREIEAAQAQGPSAEGEACK